MGREVRRVPGDWQHPMRAGAPCSLCGQAKEGYAPLFDGFNEAARLWDEGAEKWKGGLVWSYLNREWKPYDGATGTFEDYAGPRPDPVDYMPDWPAEERVYWQMYETCTEGTPISPPCATPEELARWLADNGASAFGNRTASYDDWLAMIRVGDCPSGALLPGVGLVSGVALAAGAEKKGGEK
jgi:hypothetical protein